MPLSIKNREDFSIISRIFFRVFSASLLSIVKSTLCGKVNAIFDIHKGITRFLQKIFLPNAYLFELFIKHVIYGIFLLSIYTVDKRPLFLFQCKNRGYVIIELSIHQSAAWNQQQGKVITHIGLFIFFIFRGCDKIILENSFHWPISSPSHQFSGVNTTT